MSAETVAAGRKNFTRVMGAYEALFPFITVARRDGPLLLTQAIAAARIDTEFGIEAPGAKEKFNRQVTLLKVILDTLIKLPAPDGVKEDEHFDIPSAPSPKLALMSRYRELNTDTTAIPDKLK